MLRTGLAVRSLLSVMLTRASTASEPLISILMGFQDDFGDQEPDDSTKTMVKLEEN